MKSAQREPIFGSAFVLFAEGRKEGGPGTWEHWFHRNYTSLLPDAHPSAWCHAVG